MSVNGTLDVVGDRYVLRYERRLSHPVEQVWAAITEPEHLRHWFPAEVEMEFRVGGDLRHVYDGEFVVDGGTVTAYDPPRLLEYTMSSAGIPLAGTGDERTLRFELSPAPAGCLLVFVHTFGDRAGAASFATGWQRCLDALGRHLDGKPADEGPHGFAELHEEYVERFGLAEGRLERTGDGWTVRFERQFMTHPVDELWALLTETDPAMRGSDRAEGDGVEKDRAEKDRADAGRPGMLTYHSGPGEAPPGGPAVGDDPPPRFTNGSVPAGAIVSAEPPGLLEYAWRSGDADAGRVCWELATGPGGARITLTQTIPHTAGDQCAIVLAAWHTHLELLAAHLSGATPCRSPERTEELRKHYADHR